MADSTPQQTRNPEAIRHDIDQTREELGETVETLAHKADIKAQARAKVDEVKGRIGDKRDESVNRVKGATPDSAGQAAAAVSTKARQNRVPLGIAGAAIGGFLLGRLTGRR